MEKIAKNLQLVLMCIILISTVIAVGIEIKNMIMNQSVTLADLLFYREKRWILLRLFTRLLL